MGYFKYLIPVILAMVFWYVVFAIITISIANAQTPDWVLGKEHKSFPDLKYIVGVGVSEKSPIMATQSARAELTKSISIKINSFVSDFMSREESVSESSITTSTDFILEGSQVKDGWYDHRNNLYYSFVVIERSHVLETLKTKIDNLFLNIESMLKQGNDCLVEHDIITALVHYYDGYKETDKVLPYIQTYNSVIMKEQKYKGWYDYKLLFKEKIQSIINNISLDKISEMVDQEDIPSNVRALFNGKSIKDFPIKYYEVSHKEDSDIYVKAGIDLPKFEKHFNHNLQKNLFGRLKLMNVSFKARKNIGKIIAQQGTLSFDPGAYNKSPFPNDVQPAPIRYPVRSGNWNLNLGLGNRGNLNLWGGW